MANLSHLSESQMKEILQLQERLDLLNARDACRDSFMEYIRHIWPGFIEGDHHRLIADKLTRVAKGELKRLIVNMPPRHTKSEFASIYFPSWMMGLKPDLKIMQTTHTADLSINFGRKVRNLMDTDEYKGIFPDLCVVNVIYTHNYYVYTYRGGGVATSRGLFLGWRPREPMTHRARCGPLVCGRSAQGLAGNGLIVE